MIVGIDPGKTGALVAFDGVRLIDTCDTHSPRKMYHWLMSFSPEHVFIEKAQTMPRQGIKGAFTYGTGFGMILAVTEMLQCPYTLITPREWTRSMHQGTSSEKKAKERSMQAFRRLFPMHDDIRADGIIDAALIAAYGRRLLK